MVVAARIVGLRKNRLRDNLEVGTIALHTAILAV